MPQLHQLPERASAVFDTWIGPADRDVRVTAQLLGMTTTQVSGVMARWGFAELARDIDSDRVQSRIAVARLKLAENLPAFAANVIAASASRIGPDGKSGEGGLTPTALKASLAGLAVFGIAPLTKHELAFLRADDAALSASVTDADVSAAIARGDTEYLIAAARGDALPMLGDGDPAPDPAGGVAPGDFTSAQPGGRVGSDPHSPHGTNQTIGMYEAGLPYHEAPVDGEFRVLSPKQWDEQQRAGELLDRMDFDFAEQPGEHER